MLVVLLAFALAPAVDPTSSRAQTPFGQNDTLATAGGPILNGQPVVGTLGFPGDADVFFFYVTAAGTGQSVLTIDNLGGSPQPASEMNVRLVDSLSTPVEANFGYGIRKGESRTSPIALDPGKYFVEVSTREGGGDSYRLTASGNGSAFGEYAQIAAQCGAANASLKVAQRQLERAKTRLQRAVNRLRRSQYASPDSRRTARALHTRARARVTAKRSSVETSAQERKPWCFIPQ